ncbi:hypothetical protein DFH27DRAFT_569109 [Peziza echinospora]|nr:hypothetical protein DFH27DRAFT_569109 [Peziza echinospora]
MTGVPPGSATSKIIQQQQQAQQVQKAMDESVAQQQTAAAAVGGKGKKAKGKKGKGKGSATKSNVATPTVATPDVGTSEESMEKRLHQDIESQQVEAAEKEEIKQAHKDTQEEEVFNAATLPRIGSPHGASGNVEQKIEKNTIDAVAEETKSPNAPVSYSDAVHQEAPRHAHLPPAPRFGNLEQFSGSDATCVPSVSSIATEEQDKPSVPVTSHKDILEATEQPPAPKDENALEEPLSTTHQTPVQVFELEEPDKSLEEPEFEEPEKSPEEPELEEPEKSLEEPELEEPEKSLEEPEESSIPHAEDVQALRAEHETKAPDALKPLTPEIQFEEEQPETSHAEHAETLKAAHKPPPPKVEDEIEDAELTKATFQTPVPKVAPNVQQQPPIVQEPEESIPEQAIRHEAPLTGHELRSASTEETKGTSYEHIEHKERARSPSPVLSTPAPATTAPSAIPISENTQDKVQKAESTTPASSPPKENFLATPHITHPENINPVPASSYLPSPAAAASVTIKQTGHILENREVLAAIHHNVAIIHETSPPQVPEVSSIHYPPVLAAPAESPASIIASHHTLPTHHTQPVTQPVPLHAPHYLSPPPPGVHPGAGVCAGGIITAQSTPGIIQSPAFPVPLHPSPYTSNTSTYRQDPAAADLKPYDAWKGAAAAGATDEDTEDAGMGFLRRSSQSVRVVTGAGHVPGTPVSTGGYHRRGGDDVGLVASIFNVWERSRGWWDGLFEKKRA